MQNFSYPAVFHPEEHGYSVSVPDLAGCFTQGDTLEEAVEMAREAVGLMLEDVSDPPRARDAAAVPLTGGDFVLSIPYQRGESRRVRESGMSERRSGRV